jgi:hypothetical protein
VSPLGLVLMVTGMTISGMAGYYSAAWGQPMLACLIMPAILLAAYSNQIADQISGRKK